jgi:hypothetical protein
VINGKIGKITIPLRPIALAWLLAEPVVWPIIGATSVAQLNKIMFGGSSYEAGMDIRMTN